ncbi:hypothetical protein CDA63_18280 [Hymenobacter amundsenii]|uniref:DUF2185 domain-containing protein n=1 Tax=Hymenobacter amundsenii TaxID=2006685 RepID=A0A246FGJ3_9BACT|nr:hypothetical protein [Hymenobacter amundsenii]OWP61641.1 hypothetical protein CDA63_18280 [Hymenobacter amundsenii]
MSQPLKSFADVPTTAVITTVYVVHHGSPILFVAHYEDGYWQFSGEEEELPDEDFLVLALAEVVTLDGTVVEVSDLPRGAGATRTVSGGEWVISKLVDA